MSEQERGVSHNLPEQAIDQRDEQSEKLIHFFDKIRADQVFADDETKKIFIEGLDFNEFRDLLVRVNGIVRDIPIARREVDGAKVQLESGWWGTGYIPPANEDKEPLLEETLQKAKGMANIKDMALLMSAAINAIHPFADGNGRTSRLVYFMLHEGYGGSEEEKSKLLKILGTDGRAEFDINPELIQDEILDIIKEKDLGLDLRDPRQPIGLWHYDKLGEIKGDVSEEEKQTFQKIVSRSPEFGDFGFLAVYKYLKESGKLDEKYLNTFFDKKTGQPVRTRILLDVLSSDLTPEDIRGIIEAHRETKCLYVRRLLDVIASPDNYPVDGQDSKDTLKDYFEKEIKQTTENRKKLLE